MINDGHDISLDTLRRSQKAPASATPGNAKLPRVECSEWVDEWEGNWIEEKCPKCGCSLLGNRRGQKWCSFVGGVSVPACDYGLEHSSTDGDELPTPAREK